MAKTAFDFNLDDKTRLENLFGPEGNLIGVDTNKAGALKENDIASTMELDSTHQCCGGGGGPRC